MPLLSLPVTMPLIELSGPDVGQDGVGVDVRRPVHDRAVEAGGRSLHSLEGPDDEPSPAVRTVTLSPVIRVTVRVVTLPGERCAAPADGAEPAGNPGTPEAAGMTPSAKAVTTPSTSSSGL